MFGSNDTSQLGLRHVEQAACPTRLEALENFKVASVACGGSHTVRWLRRLQKRYGRGTGQGAPPSPKAAMADMGTRAQAHR